MNTVTVGNVSVGGLHREITVDSGAGESVSNPDDWPNVDLEPSKGSVKGQRYATIKTKHAKKTAAASKRLKKRAAKTN